MSKRKLAKTSDQSSNGEWEIFNSKFGNHQLYSITKAIVKSAMALEQPVPWRPQRPGSTRNLLFLPIHRT